MSDYDQGFSDGIAGYKTKAHGDEYMRGYSDGWKIGQEIRQ